MTIQFGPRLLESIIELAVESMPDECCGILLGRNSPRGTIVEQIRPADNVAPSVRPRRYEIDPQVVFEALRAAQKGGLDLVGFYHSHPDGSLSPSANDTELAWPDKYYLIVGAGGLTNPDGKGVRCWRLASQSPGMAEVSVC